MREWKNYILVREKGWELRYEKVLGSVRDKEYVKMLSEVLEYYVLGSLKEYIECGYGPLMRLCSEVLSGMSESELCVLSEGLDGKEGLLEGELEEKLSEEMLLELVTPPERIENVVLEWAYCRYIWEAHVKLPPVSESIEAIKERKRSA